MAPSSSIVQKRSPNADNVLRPEDVRIVFFGTPAFALPALHALVTAGYTITRVVTQPDRPRGRHGVPTPTDVAGAAHSLGLHVDTPRSCRNATWQESLMTDQPTVGVVVAYGKILPSAVLGIPEHGCINIHPSLLPRWRGPAPIPWALRTGDPRTGVTLMRLDEGMDTGPIIAQQEVEIPTDATTPSLTAQLAILGAELLRVTLPRYLTGHAVPQPQAPHGVTIARALTRDDGFLQWQQPANELERQVRAFLPWPGSWTRWQTRILKVSRAHIATQQEMSSRADTPGHVAQTTDGAPAVSAGDGQWLVLDEIQLEGRRPQSGSDFLRGAAPIIGAILSP